MPGPVTPGVAVITPTHNHERYLAACIESVLAQTYTAWEMVVVDDGSTDGTTTVAERYLDPRIRVIRHYPPRGLLRLGETYQEALQATTAPLVAVLEGDDMWPSDKLARQVPQFADPKIVLAYGGAELCDAEGCSYATYLRRPAGAAAMNRPVGSIIPHLVEQNFIVACTVILRREALQRIGGFIQPPGIPYVDHPTWLSLALEGPFASDHAILGRWRRHPNQFTTSHAARDQPDNDRFLRHILDRAVERSLLPDGAGAYARLGSSGTRRSVWAEIARFRLALLGGSMSAALWAAAPLLRRRSGWPKWAGLAIIGLAARTVGSDVEWIFRRTHRFSWPPRRHRHHRSLATAGASSRTPRGDGTTGILHGDDH